MKSIFVATFYSGLDGLVPPHTLHCRKTFDGKRVIDTDIFGNKKNAFKFLRFVNGIRILRYLGVALPPSRDFHTEALDLAFLLQ